MPWGKHILVIQRFEQYLWPPVGSGRKTSVTLPLIKTFGLFYFIAGVYQLINIVLVLLNPQVYNFHRGESSIETLHESQICVPLL